MVNIISNLIKTAAIALYFSFPARNYSLCVDKKRFHWWQRWQRARVVIELYFITHSLVYSRDKMK